MPWDQFLMYQEYMFYIERWKTEDGAKENKMLNRQDEIMYNNNGSNILQDIKIFKQQVFKNNNDNNN